jgi:DNA-directed RNA polymerase specialized sigma24 family protein
LAEFASAIGVPEAAVIAELKAGSESAYTWLVGEFHQPVYSVIYRILTDPSDAADTTQEVFLKVFRGMKYFQASLKTSTIASPFAKLEPPPLVVPAQSQRNVDGAIRQRRVLSF